MVLAQKSTVSSTGCRHERPCPSRTSVLEINEAPKKFPKVKSWRKAADVELQTWEDMPTRTGAPENLEKAEILSTGCNLWLPNLTPSHPWSHARLKVPGDGLARPWATMAG